MMLVSPVLETDGDDPCVETLVLLLIFLLFFFMNILSSTAIASS